VFHPASRVKKIWIPDPDPRQRLGIFDPKIVSKFSVIWSGKFIPDPHLDFLPIPDPGSKDEKGTGSRIPDSDRQHCLNPSNGTNWMMLTMGSNIQQALPHALVKFHQKSGPLT
jgi:hypothetical protein